MEGTAYRETLMQMAPPPFPRGPAPLPPHCPELDLSLTLTPEPPQRTNRRSHTQPRKVRFDVSFESHTKPCAPHRATSVDLPLVSMAIPERCHSQSAAPKPPYKDMSGPNTERHTVIGECAESDGQLEEGAGLNTTLALKAELEKLKEEEFDSHKAVQEKLQKSVLTQESIRASAAKGLNFPRSQHLYRALVSVNLSHDQLISQVLRDRPALAPPPLSHSSKVESGPAEGPDLLAFYSPQHVIRETPQLPGDGGPWPRPRAVCKPRSATFHLHQHCRRWEA